MDAPRRTKDFAKTLRRRMSLPEVLIWKALKGRQQDGLHFRRQHPVGPYVFDFYCDSARLAVEIDGDGHSFGDQPLKDERRDAYLASLGVRTLRLRAAYVLESVDDAIRMILDAARSSPARGGGPRSGGGGSRAPSPVDRDADAELVNPHSRFAAAPPVGEHLV